MIKKILVLEILFLVSNFFPLLSMEVNAASIQQASPEQQRFYLVRAAIAKEQHNYNDVYYNAIGDGDLLDNIIECLDSHKSIMHYLASGQLLFDDNYISNARYLREIKYLKEYLGIGNIGWLLLYISKRKQGILKFEGASPDEQIAALLMQLRSS